MSIKIVRVDENTWDRTSQKAIDDGFAFLDLPDIGPCEVVSWHGSDHEPEHVYQIGVQPLNWADPVA